MILAAFYMPGETALGLACDRRARFTMERLQADLYAIALVKGAMRTSLALCVALTICVTLDVTRHTRQALRSRLFFPSGNSRAGEIA
ncbi:hypothetical protein G6L33_22265 [Agrobacterium rhizogenes]|nr:hypothetical protein [Rhizobium rhizogenes]NTH66588.1 hypothetical protein [Rhizobium rhizogenes]